MTRLLCGSFRKKPIGLRNQLGSLAGKPRLINGKGRRQPNGKEGGFALLCGWLKEKFDNTYNGQSELLAVRKKHEELRTEEIWSCG